MGNLENISADYLREILAQVDDTDAAKRLMVAITYKEVDELSQNEAASLYGFSSGWASRWFRRLERLDDEPFEDVVYDDSRPGRPSALSDEQRTQFKSVLNEPPENLGIDAPAWTVDLAQRYLKETFDVEYSDRHVRRLMKEAGLTWKRVTLDADAFDENEQEGIDDDPSKHRTIWTK